MSKSPSNQLRTVSVQVTTAVALKNRRIKIKPNQKGTSAIYDATK